VELLMKKYSYSARDFKTITLPDSLQDTGILHG
ncbi:uncharacterized protein METZ01_LOCUS474327, partial [marine metagenome]